MTDADADADGDGDGDAGPTVETDIHPMVAAYRHDIHKIRGVAHDDARTHVSGHRVNESVPLGADGDAALLSRPRGDPDQTVDNHHSNTRLTLIGATARPLDIYDDTDITSSDLAALIEPDDPADAHQVWLENRFAALYNESLYYPQTSLKYHTLLVGALLDNYYAGADFADLHLVVDDADAPVTPHRTVLHTDWLSLRLTATPGDRPAASLGSAPARSWADVWGRLPDHGLPDTPPARILDAQLRRIRAWSTALQYIEDYIHMVDRLGLEVSR
jgi:hypothetical protein